MNSHKISTQTRNARSCRKSHRNFLHWYEEYTAKMIQLFILSRLIKCNKKIMVSIHVYKITKFMLRKLHKEYKLHGTCTIALFRLKDLMVIIGTITLQITVSTSKYISGKILSKRMSILLHC